MNRRDFWDRCLRAYDALTFLQDYRAELEHAADRLDARPGETVLDAGSGTGNLSILLRGRGVRAVSMDFSPVAGRIHLEKDPGAEVLQASLEEPLPFRDENFDAVACLSVLFAVSPEGTRTALREFRRVLKPGGRLVITVMRPGHSKLKVLRAHLRSRFRQLPLLAFLVETRSTLLPLLRMLYYNLRMYRLRGRGGYRRFGREELEGEVRAAGLKVDEYEATYGGRFHLLACSAPGARPGPRSCGPRRRAPRESGVLLPA